MKLLLGIVGAGKVGSTLARLWFKAGYKIAVIYNRSEEKAAQLAQLTEARVAQSIDELVDSSDIVFLTVADDAIEVLANRMQHLNWQGKAIVHTSGAASIDKLKVLADVGAMVGSLHPAFPFADIESAMANLAGTTFAIEAQNVQLQQWLSELVLTIDGQILLIPEGKKALYHAALVMASNYTVTLFATAQAMLKSLDADPAAVDNALLTLVRATGDNIAAQGIPDALTGPLTRSDIGTIQSHLDVIDDDIRIQAYIVLARLSYPMLRQRGIDTHTIDKLFQDKT